MLRPWEVPVGDLLRHPGTKRDLEVSSELGEVAVTGSRALAGSETTFRGTLESLDATSIRVRGHVIARWEGECRRCLGPAVGDLDIDVSELYEREPESEEIYALPTDRLDLEPLVRDAIYLELPLAPLCMEDCQGLCPECGADRNTVDCGHAAEQLDPRWAALRELGEQN